MNKKFFIAVITAVFGSLTLGACTPPMPPELKAQLADQNISCESGEFVVNSFPELTNVADWMSEFNSYCGSNGEVVTELFGNETKPDAIIAVEDLSSDVCVVSKSIPVGLDAAVPVVSIGEIGGLILSPKVLESIFNGSISQWDSPEIQSLNPDLELPSTPIVVDGNVSKAQLDSFVLWMNSLDATTWKRIPSVFDTSAALTIPTEQVLEDDSLAQTEEDSNQASEDFIDPTLEDGGIKISSYSEASNFGFAMVSIKTDSQVIDADLDSIASGATQLRFQDEKNFSRPIYDINIPAVALQGDDDPTPPWGGIFSIMFNACQGPNEKVVQAFARYSIRLQAQGSLVDLNISSLSEEIRLPLLDYLAVGIASPLPIPSELPSDELTSIEESPTPEPSPSDS